MHEYEFSRFVNRSCLKCSMQHKLLFEKPKQKLKIYWQIMREIRWFMLFFPSLSSSWSGICHQLFKMMTFTCFLFVSAKHMAGFFPWRRSVMTVCLLIYVAFANRLLEESRPTTVLQQYLLEAFYALEI